MRGCLTRIMRSTWSPLRCRVADCVLPLREDGQSAHNSVQFGQYNEWSCLYRSAKWTFRKKWMLIACYELRIRNWSMEAFFFPGVYSQDSPWSYLQRWRGCTLHLGNAWEPSEKWHRVAQTMERKFMIPANSVWDMRIIWSKCVVLIANQQKQNQHKHVDFFSFSLIHLFCVSFDQCIFFLNWLQRVSCLYFEIFTIFPRPALSGIKTFGMGYTEKTNRLLVSNSEIPSSGEFPPNQTQTLLIFSFQNKYFHPHCNAALPGITDLGQGRDGGRTPIFFGSFWFVGPGWWETPPPPFLTTDLSDGVGESLPLLRPLLEMLLPPAVVLPGPRAGPRYL